MCDTSFSSSLPPPPPKGSLASCPPNTSQISPPIFSPYLLKVSSNALPLGTPALCAGGLVQGNRGSALVSTGFSSGINPGNTISLPVTPILGLNFPLSQPNMIPWTPIYLASVPATRGKTQRKREGRRKRQRNNNTTPETPANDRDDPLSPLNSGWQPVDDVSVRHKPSGHVPLPKIPTFKPVSEEKTQKVMENKPLVAAKATEEDFMPGRIAEVFLFVRPLLNRKKILRAKFSSVANDQEITAMHDSFLQFYVGDLNATREQFLSHSFSSWESAVVALSIVIRSYVSGFTVHIWTKGKNKKGFDVIRLQCHTRSNRSSSKTKSSDCSTPVEATGEPTVRPTPKTKDGECIWKACIVCDEKGANFKRIDDFSVHTKHCFGTFSRLTPLEVSFQNDIPVSLRYITMQKLRQDLVEPETLSQRRWRMGSVVNSNIDAVFLERLKTKKEEECISNRKELNIEVDEGADYVLRYLSMLHQEERVESFVEFKIEIKRPEITAIYMMWPEGKRLLKTHSDVIYCDSMWNTSKQCLFALTIVLVDENYKLRLGCIGLVKVEDKTAWASFFSWVKTVVPTFNPSCIQTDGAEYIYNGFQSVMGDGALHIVCWWHRRESMLRLYQLKRSWKIALLNMTYASSEEELTALGNRARSVGQRLGMQTGRIESWVGNCERASLIRLKVFTGGTVTNSFAESVNARLRDIGMTVTFPMLSVLRYLHTYMWKHYYETCRPMVVNTHVRRILQEEVLNRVTNGTLKLFSKLVYRSQRTCQSFPPVRSPVGIMSVRVDDTVQCIKVSRGGKKITYQKIVSWPVVWAEGVPLCNCNALIYKGIPCKHIIKSALDLNLKIPLKCFNPRFYLPEILYDRFLDDQEEQGGDPDDGDGEQDTTELDSSTATDDSCSWQDTDKEESNEDGLVEPDAVEYCEEDEQSDVVDDQQVDGSPMASLSSSCDTNSSFKLNPDEISLFSQLEGKANDLVEVRGVPEFTQSADKMLQTLSQYVDSLIRAHSAAVRLCDDDETQETLTASVDTSLITTVNQEEIKSICDSLHITTAGVDLRNPSDAMSRFRGKLRATNLRLLQVLRNCPEAGKAYFKVFCDWIDGLVTKCRTKQSSEKAGFSGVEGCPTSKSYFKTPQTVKRYTVQALQEAREKDKSVLSQQNLAIPSSTIYCSAEDDALFACSVSQDPEIDSLQSVSTEQTPSTKAKRRKRTTIDSDVIVLDDTTKTLSSSNSKPRKRAKRGGKQQVGT